MSHSKLSVIETPLNKWAVIKPLEIARENAYSNIYMPKWMPFGMTHMGIFNTLDEAMQRMATLRETEGI